MKKTFLFMPVRQGVVLERKFACWCNTCMRASAPGEGSMDTMYRCVGCKSGLPWKETQIERTDPAGVAMRQKRALLHARELAKQLQRKFQQSDNPVWVAVQNRGEDEPDQCESHCPHTAHALMNGSMLSILMIATGAGILLAEHFASRKSMISAGLLGAPAMMRVTLKLLSSGLIVMSVEAMSGASFALGKGHKR